MWQQGQPGSQAYAAGAVAQHSTSVLAQPEGSLQVVGVGRRGAEGLEQLSGTLPGAQFWRLDEDGREFAPGGTRASDAAAATVAAGLNRVLQQTPSLPRAAAATPLPRSFSGLAFVLASADNSADGSAAVLDFVQHARSKGIMAVAAVTKPFAFEGARKLQAAEKLIRELKSDADMVVVVEQNKLCGGSGAEAMTVAQAIAIADRALVSSVQAIADAVVAPQLLHLAAGRERWHGRSEPDSFSTRCRLFQQLFLHNGSAVLGRGMAALPRSAVHGAPPAAVLAHMAADAARAAVESPFLDGQLANVDSLLCCIGMPPAAHLGAGYQSPAEDERDQRAAIQAARGMLDALLPNAYSDVAVCCYQHDTAQAELAPGNQLQLEVCLLVAAQPGAVRTAPPPASTHNQRLAAASEPGSSSGREADAERRERSWSAMSALAGGSASAYRAPTPATLSSMGRGTLRSAPEPEPLQAAQSAALVDSLTALSLDLPPQAARWRKQQRKSIAPLLGPALARNAAAAAAARTVGGGRDDEDGEEEEEEERQRRGLFGGLFQKLAAPPSSIQSRTAGILQADRSESSLDEADGLL